MTSPHLRLPLLLSATSADPARSPVPRFWAKSVRFRRNCCWTRHELIQMRFTEENWGPFSADFLEAQLKGCEAGITPVRAAGEQPRATASQIAPALLKS